MEEGSVTSKIGRPVSLEQFIIGMAYGSHRIVPRVSIKLNELAKHESGDWMTTSGATLTEQFQTTRDDPETWRATLEDNAEPEIIANQMAFLGHWAKAETMAMVMTISWHG